MSFLSFPPNQARKPLAIVLPDGRKQLTQWFKATTTGEFPQELVGAAYAVNSSHPWADAPTGWTGLRLTYKQMDDSTGFPPGGQDSQPLVRLIYEQISQTGETQTGGVPLTQIPDARKQAVYTYVMFSTSTYTPLVPGTASVTIGADTYYLWEETNTNDGTLRNITRTYQTAGTTATSTQTLFNGALLKQTITSFKTVPATPANYTAIGTATRNPSGYPVYDYSFVSAAAAVGAGGEISRDFYNSQGATTAFNPASPNTGDGAVRCVIKWLTDPAVTSDPTTGPTSFVRVGVDQQDAEGYKVWTVTYGFGDGLVVDDSTISASGALVIYHRIALGSAPSTPSATIGGTVTLFETATRNADGYEIFERRWAEGDGQASITTRGEQDGAIVYTVTDYSVAASTPAYPGSGSNTLVSLTQKPEGGYFVNTATYVKWPATVTFRKMMSFLYPGLAAFSGAPVLFNMTPPVTMSILASVEVSYDTSQITTTPWTVESWAKLNTQWIPYTNPGVSPTPGSPPADTTTGPPQGNSESLGGYIAGASGISDTDEFFNGVFVATYSATLSASTPSARPTGSTTIAVDNDPYLVSTSGTVVYRRMVTTYSF